ncbi:beta/gamma crystallin domain-containing protein [Micromonospora sp. NPDC049151]|uniref:beta/gamma crystallin domain-containing protein n=1 Tax=unclassified Micromonospora TaxID=2617518 RepID=UPI0033F0369D
MRRGVKRAITAAAATGLALAAIPGTPAFAISKVSCTSSTVDIITALNYHHCYSGAGTAYTTINGVVRIKAGNNTAFVTLSNGDMIYYNPGESTTFPAPGKTITAVRIV